MEFSGTVRLQRSAKQKIRYFLKETLRPRSKEEYAEVFKCGTVKKRVPWLYLRVLAAGFLLFCIAVLVYRIDGGSVSYMTAALFGALMVNIPVLVFFYELNPLRDISLLTLFLTVIVGGALTCAVILLGYDFIYDGFGDSPWVSLLWTGFWEELVKAAFAISAVVLLKKKSPLACFLIGFAVGTGYSILEDLGYIFGYSRSPTTNVMWVVLMSVGRSLSCGVSHAPWTGIIAWAFAEFKKPFLNFRFYGVVAASMILHYFADVPFFADEVAFLTGLNFGWLIEAVVVASIVAIVYFIWRKAFREISAEICESGGVSARSKLNHAGNVVAVACAAVFGIFTLAGCAQSTGYRNTYERFDDKESFISYVQNGLELYCERNREYDPEKEDCSRYILESTTICAVQKERYGDYDYYYVYRFSEEEGARLESIGVLVEDEIYYLAVINVYEGFSVVNYREPTYFNPVPKPPEIIEDEPEEPTEPTEPEEPEEPEEPTEPVVPTEVTEFFFINGFSVYYDNENSQYVINMGIQEIDNTAAYIAFGALAGATAIGGAAAVLILKIKSRRYDNDR